MYLSFSVENILTIGVMLLLWMLALHLAGQAGLAIGNWLPGGS